MGVSVLVGETGDYSDTEFDVLGAFEDEESALAAVPVAEKLCDKLHLIQGVTGAVQHYTRRSCYCRCSCVLCLSTMNPSTLEKHYERLAQQDAEAKAAEAKLLLPSLAEYLSAETTHLLAEELKHVLQTLAENSSLSARLVANSVGRIKAAVDTYVAVADQEDNAADRRALCDAITSASVDRFEHMGYVPANVQTMLKQIKECGKV